MSDFSNGVRAAGLGPAFMGIFFAIGLATLVGAGLLAASERRFLATALPAEGTVVDLEAVRSSGKGASTVYYPLFEFTAEGRTVRVRGKSGSSSAAYARGERVRVRYTPGTPEQAEIFSLSEQWGAPFIMALIGLAFIGISGASLSAGLRRKRRVAWLKENGRRIQADTVTSGPDRSHALNGRGPFRLRAQWQDPETRRIHLFESGPLWFDPAPYADRKTVDVLIDPQDPGTYWMDLSFLPGQA